MQNKGRSPTIRDVAKEAGVSIASVSRVLNKVEPFSNLLKARINAAIDKIGYIHTPREHTALQGIVVVLIPDTNNLYFMEILQGIEDQARRSGYLINIVTVTRNPQYKLNLLRWLTKSRCSGIVFSSSAEGFTDSDLEYLQEEEGIPLVLLNRRLPSPDFAGIQINFVDAMYRATTYILSLGHSRIAFLGRPSFSESANKKKAGIEKALVEAGLSLQKGMYLEGLPTIEWGYYGTNILLDYSPSQRPTAIVGLNDLVAFGALHALRQKKFNVPKDISVIGFDDIAMSSHSSPPLTTIAAPKYDMGMLSMQIIDQLRNSPSAKGGLFTLMESPLIIRESTGPCPR
jgi:DNA-binding LacI/PurR family transcriptional regulator